MACRSFPVGAPRQNTAWTTIELKSSDGDSWYRALIVDLRRRWSNGVSFQSSYTWADSEDTTQASTFFSDATNGTTSAFPEYIPDYNRGPSDFNTEHNWVMNATWDLPWGRDLTGVSGVLLSGWRVAGIATLRSGYPLTVFVQNNRSRSQWQPSLGPGIGRDRASYAPGFGPDNAVNGDPAQWFNPQAFALQPAGTFGDTGRGDLTGPDLRTVDLAFSKDNRVLDRRLGQPPRTAHRGIQPVQPRELRHPEPDRVRGRGRRRAGGRQLRPHPQHGDVGQADAAGAATAVLGNAACRYGRRRHRGSIPRGATRASRVARAF